MEAKHLMSETAKKSPNGNVKKGSIAAKAQRNEALEKNKMADEVAKIKDTKIAKLEEEAKVKDTKIAKLEEEAKVKDTKIAKLEEEARLRTPRLQS